jgi:hypothetical protein
MLLVFVKGIALMRSNKLVLIGLMFFSISSHGRENFGDEVVKCLAGKHADPDAENFSALAKECDHVVEEKIKSGTVESFSGLNDPDLPIEYDGSAGKDLEECAKKAANLIDDDRSDAITISKAIPFRCGKEITAFGKAVRSALKFRNVDLLTRANTENSIVSDMNQGNPFIRVVLEQRRVRDCLKSKKHQRKECDAIDK